MLSVFRGAGKSRARTPGGTPVPICAPRGGWFEVFGGCCRCGLGGLRRVALQSHANTRALADRAAALDGVRVAFRDFFHETVLVLDRPVAPVLEALAQQDVLGGYDLSADYPELGAALLVCATEQRSPADIDTYVNALRDTLARSRAA